MKSILLLLVTLIPWRSVAAALPEKPNFIFILADDMGYGDTGPYGSTKNRTPNLDRMAREGMKFTSFYAAPVCTPSRAQILTGCYAKRVSLPDVIFPRSPIGLNTNEHTIASLLKAQGYATLAVGKWHVGDDRRFLPTHHGFDHYLGLPYSNDMGGEEPGKDTDRHKNHRPPLPLVRDLDVIETLKPDDQDKLTALYTGEAVKFVRENKDHPFFLYLPHNAVHIPLHPGAKFRGKSANGLYGDWVEEVDWCVGQVLDAVRDAGIGGRTLVVFSSDNGPWLAKGTNAGTAGPLRSGKGSTYEGGMREPMIAWWPGLVAPGTVCDAVAGNIDLLPTFVKLAGGSVPGDHKIDGRDISPLILGQSTQSPHDAFYYFASTSLQAVRSGPWKLAIVPQYEGHGPYQAIVPDWNHLQPPRLYNLDEDIGEQHDMAAAHPGVVQRLMASIREMDADLGVGKAGPGVRAPGRVPNPTGLWLKGQEPAPLTPYKTGEVLKIGDEFSGDESPQIARKGFRISCKVEPKSENAVIVAQGGSRVGYSLYLTDGKPTFGVRENGNLAAISLPFVPEGAYVLSAELKPDATMSLSANDKPAVTGRAAGLISKQPAEGMCVGFDDGAAVGEYKQKGTTRYKGALTDLKIEVTP